MYHICNIMMDKCFENVTFFLDISYFNDSIYNIYRELQFSLGLACYHKSGGIIMNELLGSRIKALRNAKKFTQEQIATQIGVSRQKYARIESGANTITLEVLSRIANVLDVTVADITRVLDETPVVAYRAGSENTSSEKIFDMLDLFYANKHLYAKLQHDDID